MNVPRGLGQSPSPLIIAIANAIAQEEGYNTPGTIAQRQNNPGNLRSGPNQSGTASGYAVYSTVSAGWQDLYSLIEKIIGYGVNLYQFFGGGLGYPGYAPAADSNQPTAYANFVAAQTGIDPNIPLNTLDPNSFATTATVPVPALIPCDPTSDPNCTSTDASGNSCDPTVSDCTQASVPSPSGTTSGGASTGTIVLIGLGALAGLWLVSRLFD